LGFHPIDIYIYKPIAFQELTFIQYFKQYTHDHKLYPTYQIFEKDDIGLIIFLNKKLVWFTDFHPVHNSESFFYKYCITKKSFRGKILFSKINVQFSYVCECQIRGFFTI
jgi:hypothetical protein